MSNRKQQIEKIAENFSTLMRKMMSEFRNSPQKLEVTFVQGHVLHIVKHHSGIGIKEIAKTLDITPSAATQLIDGLVDHGFLIRKESETDRRAIKIELSEKSKKYFSTFMSRKMEKLNLIFDVLSDQELTRFCELSDKIKNKIINSK